MQGNREFKHRKCRSLRWKSRRAAKKKELMKKVLFSRIARGESDSVVLCVVLKRRGGLGWEIDIHT